MIASTAWERLKVNLTARGRFIDYWSLVHFGVGLVVGFMLAQRDISFGTGLLIAAVLFVLWEWIEPELHRFAGREFPERWTNQVTDVFVATAGYAVGFVISSSRLMLVILFEIVDFLTR